MTTYSETPGGSALSLWRQLTLAAPVWEELEGSSTAVTLAPWAVVSPVFFTMTTTSSRVVAATTEVEPEGGICNDVVTRGSVVVVVVAFLLTGFEDPVDAVVVEVVVTAGSVVVVEGC